MSRIRGLTDEYKIIIYDNRCEKTPIQDFSRIGVSKVMGCRLGISLCTSQPACSDVPNAP